jgi:hypothetical protein
MNSNKQDNRILPITQTNQINSGNLVKPSNLSKTNNFV